MNKNKFYQYIEAWYPPVVSTALLVVSCFVDYPNFGANRKDIISGTLSFGAIILGFLATSKTILIGFKDNLSYAKLKEKDEGQSQTAHNTMLYARPPSSYDVLMETARKASKRAFGYSMVPIPGPATGLPEGEAAYQGHVAKRMREGWRKWAPQFDGLGRPAIKYGFKVTTDPMRIEQIGRTVLRLQEQGRIKRIPSMPPPA